MNKPNYHGIMPRERFTLARHGCASGTGYGPRQVDLFSLTRTAWFY